MIYVQILRGLVRCHFLWVNCADVWLCSGTIQLPLHEDGWRWIIRKFSTCSASSGLLAAVPANITVFTNFISPFISSHSHRILLFLSFCWFCALVSILGLWAVSYVELQANWRYSSGHMRVSLQIKSHLLWSFHSFYLVTCKKRS